jgi:hypothetical protein
MKKFVLLVTAIAVLAVPAMASAANYTATFTFPVIGGGHSYDITVNCDTGAYTGTGDALAYTGGESVSGTLSPTSNSGAGAYNRTTVGDYPGYTFTYALTSADGTNYTGTLTDSTATYPVTSVVSNSTQTTACAPPPLPTPASKDACKKGGWESLFRSNGTSFKNQGDCVSYVANGK